MIKKVEQIVWTDGDQNINAVGFIVKETKSHTYLSLTQSYGLYLDIKKIDKGHIVSRSPITAKHRRQI